MERLAKEEEEKEEEEVVVAVATEAFLLLQALDVTDVLARADNVQARRTHAVTLLKKDR